MWVGGVAARYRSRALRRLPPPYRVALAPQFQRQSLLHFQRFRPAQRTDVLVETGPQIAAVLPHDAARQVVAFGVAVARLVLLEALLRRLAGHPYIQAFQRTVVLRIGLSEPPVLGENLPRKLDHIDAVGGGHGGP